MSSDTDFFLQVFDIVRMIPRGRVTTYGHIARALGTGRAARMVGWAMNASHQHDAGIPAHRVVNRKGMLTGKMHFSDPDEMQRRLESEGVEVIDDAVRNFSSLLWDPVELADKL